MAAKGEKNGSERGATGSGKRRIRQLEIVEEPSFAQILWHHVRTNAMGRVLAAFALLFLVVLINLLVSGDQFDLFFTLIGLEFGLLLLALWLFNIIKSGKNN